MASSLLEQAQELNHQEQVVKFALTKLPQIEMLASYVENLWSLFTLTQGFHQYRAEFYAKPRTDATATECKVPSAGIWVLIQPVNLGVSRRVFSSTLQTLSCT